MERWRAVTEGSDLMGEGWGWEAMLQPEATSSTKVFLNFYGLLYNKKRFKLIGTDNSMVVVGREGKVEKDMGG